jgi:hypothetical protein
MIVSAPVERLEVGSSGGCVELDMPVPVGQEARSLFGSAIFSSKFPFMVSSSPPPRKRTKHSSSTLKSPNQPRLFAPFRALGLVSNHVPFVLQSRSYKGSSEGPRIHLLTCLGKAWAMWEGAKMGLLFVG